MESVQSSSETRQDGRAGPAARVRFSIARWSAWLADEKPTGARPELPELPLLLRRRASFADALALRVAFDCAGSLGPMPSVFCSRHGELHRSVEMLSALARGEGLSPTTFGHSVHNTAAALYSIARGDTSASSALAAGSDTLAEGVLEACGILSEGAPRVLLAAYDDRLPAELARFAEPQDRPAALGLILEPAGADGFSLELRPADGAAKPCADSQIVSVARFLRSSARALETNNGPRLWVWSRDD